MLHHFGDLPIKTFQPKKWIDEYNVELTPIYIFETKKKSFEAESS